MQEFTDRRDGKRATLVAPVNCSILAEGNGEFSGILVDMSGDGIGLYTYYELDEGHDIELCSDVLWGECKTASVMWSKKVSKDLFRVGLSLN